MSRDGITIGAARLSVSAWVGELAQSVAWREDVRAFWTVYDAHFEEIVARNRRALAVQPELGELMRALGPEEVRERAQEVRAAARRATLDEDWRSYLEVMGRRAEEYARMGVSFASWFRSVTSWRSLLIPYLAESYADDPDRIAAAIRGMDAYLDVTVAALGERYLLAAQRQAEQRHQEAAALADAARVVAQGALAREAVASIVGAAMRVVPSRVVAVMVPRDDARTLEVVAVAGIDQTWVSRRFPVTEGITGRAFRTGEPQLVSDVRLDPDYVLWMQDIRSHLAIPMRAQGWTVGVLDLEAEEVGRFGEKELRLMEGFAAHAATALEMERLLRELTERERELRTALNEAEALALATRALAAESVAGDVLNGILAAAQLAVPASHAILVVARETGGLEVAAVVGAPTEWVGRRDGLMEGITGRAFRTREVQLVRDIREDPDYREWVEAVGSELAVPILSHGEAVGVINLESPEVAHFGPRDAYVLRSFAEYAAIALENESSLRAQREAEGEARRQLDFVQRVLDVTEGVYVVDRDGDLLFMNPAAERALGWTAGELKGLNMHDAVHFQRAGGGRVSRDECPLRLVTREITTYRSEDDVLTRKDGAIVPVAYTASTLTRDGQITGAVIAFRDLTERRDLERLARQQAVLEDASRAKSAFLANMSHELRTPLHAVIGFTGLLEEQLADSVNAKQQRYLTNVRAAGEHLMALIGDVLDIARVEAGKLDFHPEPVPLNVLLESVVAAGSLSARSKGLQFETTPLPAVAIRVDADRLRQVLYNLVSNAVKFTPPGGRVALNTTIDGRGVRFTVEDSGIGIPAEQHSRVFGVFERLHEGRFEASGTGLGLALTKRLVEMHGGTISFESAEGAGTTFRVWIPDVVESALSPSPGS